MMTEANIAAWACEAKIHFSDKPSMCVTGSYCILKWLAVSKML